MYWVNKDDPRSGNPDRSDGQLPLWDYPVSLWASGASAQNPFLIVSPQQSSTVSRAPFVALATHANPQSITRVLFYLNDTLVGEAKTQPYIVTITPPTSGPATLRAVAEGPQSSEETSVTFTIQ